MNDHDTSWNSVSKLQPLAVCQIYYMLNEMMQMMKLSAAEGKPLDVSGESEFMQAVKSKDGSKVWAVIDELMDTMKLNNPRVYSYIIEKIKSID